MLGSAKDVFQGRVETLLQSWIDAIAMVLMEGGTDEELARQRGEDGVIAIQGALVLS